MGRMMELLHNYVLNVAIVSWVSAQILKTLLYLVIRKKFEPERLVRAGGMPSAHSATVCGLMIAISRHSGFTSPEFSIAFVLAAVVMYDAMGVRRAAGEQAKVLNKIIEKHSENENNDFDRQAELKEYLGHTPLQVLAGGLLGILVAMILPM